MIQSNCKHFDDRAYKDAYRSRIVVPVSWFIGLAVIVGVQVLVLHRLYIFSRRLTPRLSSKKKLAFFALFSLDIATAIVGALSYALCVRSAPLDLVARNLTVSSANPAPSDFPSTRTSFEKFSDRRRHCWSGSVLEPPP